MFGRRAYIRTVYVIGISLVVFIIWQIIMLPNSANHDVDHFVKNDFLNIQSKIVSAKPKSDYDRNNAFMQHCEDDIMYAEPKLRIISSNLTESEKAASSSINCTLGRIMSARVVYPICLYDTVNDSSISGTLIRGKTLFEEENLESISTWLKQLGDADFIDIGANIGLYTNMAAELGYNVLAVEPRSDNVLRIRKALNMRDLQNKVTIVQNAVSDIRSRMNLLTHKSEQGRTIVVCDKDCSGSVSESCLETKVDTILMDDLLYARNISKAVMKIDVEGHEIKAFSSSQLFFQKVKIPVILMEWDWRQRFQSRYNKDREVVQNFMKLLMIRKYRPYDSQGNTLRLDKWDSWPVDVHWLLYNGL